MTQTLQDVRYPVNVRGACLAEALFGHGPPCSGGFCLTRLRLGR